MLIFFGFDLYIKFSPMPHTINKASKPLDGLFGWVTLRISKKIHVFFWMMINHILPDFWKKESVLSLLKLASTSFKQHVPPCENRGFPTSWPVKSQGPNKSLRRLEDTCLVFLVDFCSNWNPLELEETKYSPTWNSMIGRCISYWNSPLF